MESSAGDSAAKVTHIALQGGDVYLVGTAHVSKDSVLDVRRTIERVEPDTVCVELCESRYQALTQRDNWQKMDIFKIVRQGKSLLLLAQLMLTSFYRRLGEKLGVKPGAEMLEAVRLAQEHGAELVLADRDIQITLKRTYGYLGFWTKLRLLFGLSVGIFSGEEIDEETVEKLKEKDQLEAVMAEFTGKFPEIKKRLIDERDIYIAQKIRRARGQKIVAVVGAGHIKGIKRHIGRDEPIDWLQELPPRTVWPVVLKWGIPAAIIGIFVLGFFRQGSGRSVENIYIWILVNGLLSAAGAAAALGHPLTILSAFLAAPLTSLNPLMAAGWVAGLVQAWLRRPKVSDMEDLPNAINTVKGWWTNPVTKILLVVALANLGSVLGTWIAGTWIFTRSV